MTTRVIEDPYLPNTTGDGGGPQIEDPVLPPWNPDGGGEPDTPIDLYIPYWMRGTPLEQIYIDAWIETGDTGLALESVRESDDYAQIFAGNVRDDGSVRYDENTYLSMIDMFSNTILSVGLNPDLFQGYYAGLIEGEVSPSEFTSRVEMVYDRVIDAAPEVAAQLDEYYGYGFTPQSILASFLNPDIGNLILDKQISLAEIGAEASVRGFDIAQNFADQLFEAGTDTKSEAAQFFGLAENALPTLTALATRHMDPDDGFDIYEFAAGQLLSDPLQRSRIRLLLNQETASFGQSPDTAFVRSTSGVRAGGLTGLAEL